MRRSAYTYYRCAKYNSKNHPRVRLSESEIEKQMLASFDTLRIKDDAMRTWFEKVLKARVKEVSHQEKEGKTELQRQLTNMKSQRDRLLNMRLSDEVDEATFASKNTELRDRIARLQAEIEPI